MVYYFSKQRRKLVSQALSGFFAEQKAWMLAQYRGLEQKWPILCDQGIEEEIEDSDLFRGWDDFCTVDEYRIGELVNGAFLFCVEEGFVNENSIRVFQRAHQEYHIEDSEGNLLTVDELIALL